LAATSGRVAGWISTVKALPTPLLVALATSTVMANDWPRFRGPDDDNSLPGARIATSFPDSGPKILWSVDVNEGYGGAAISGDEVFTMDRVDQQKDILQCLGLADGKVRWKWEHEVAGRISHPGSRGVPTVEANAVYVTSGFGHVYCVDRKTHQARWVVDVMKTFGAEAPRFGYSIHPVVHGGMCIVAPTGDSAGLAALDKKTGKTIWKSAPVGDSHSSPLLVQLLDREMIVMPGSKDGTLMFTGFDPETGKQLFQYTEKLSGGRHNSIPNITVVDRDTVILTGGYGQGTQVLELAEKEGAIEVTRSRSLVAGARIHPALMVGRRLYLSVGSSRGGGGRVGGRSRGDRGPGGSTRPPRGPGERGRGAGGPGGGGGPGAAAGESGLVCMDLTGKVLWNSGSNPGLGQGSIIHAGGLIISQDGDDGSLRLIQPGDSYREVAIGKVFSKDPGRELWAPMALSDGRLVVRSQRQMVCVDLRP